MTTNGNAHLITTMSELETLFSEKPYGPSLVKEIDHISPQYRALIEAAIKEPKEKKTVKKVTKKALVIESDDDDDEDA